MTATAPKYLNDKATAALIRRVLKAAFPATKFSVRMSGAGSVDVRYTDGPSTARVNALIGHMTAGSFDGMTDMYEQDDTRFAAIDGELYRFGARFIFVTREMSPRFLSRIVRAVLATDRGCDLTPEAAARIADACAVTEATADTSPLWKVLNTTRTKGYKYADQLVHEAAADRRTVREVAA
jgi:hypothetical protein